MIVAVFVAGRSRRLNHRVRMQQRQINARKVRFAVILQAVSVSVQPDGVANFTRLDRADVHVVQFLSRFQHHQPGCGRAALSRLDTGAAAAPLRSANSSPPGRDEAQRICAASDEAEVYPAVVADGLLRDNAAIFIEQRHGHARKRGVRRRSARRPHWYPATRGR